MIRRRAVLWYWLPVVIWMVMILTLSSQSTLPKKNDPITGEPLPQMYPVAKAWHVFEYTVLSLLLFRALQNQAGGVGLTPLRAAVTASAICLLFGGLDEVRQSFVPKREATALDVAIDAAAAAAAAFLTAGWIHLRPGRSRLPPPRAPLVSDLTRQPEG